MKIRILSDLHLEFEAWIPPPAAADVVVLAGDIHHHAHGLGWARDTFGDAEIVYVVGNHEYYGSSLAALDTMYKTAAAFGVHLLEQGDIVIDGVRFLGATLWTDHCLYGKEAQGAAMQAAKGAMMDYRLIRTDRGLLTPEDTTELHRSAAGWIETALAIPFAGKAVLVTHHGIHPRSVAPRFENDPLNPAFASDLRGLVEGRGLSLCCHGHTHDARDFMMGTTRVVCNPKGYPGELPADRGFRPALVIEI